VGQAVSPNSPFRCEHPPLSTRKNAFHDMASTNPMFLRCCAVSSGNFPLRAFYASSWRSIRTLRSPDRKNAPALHVS